MTDKNDDSQAWLAGQFAASGDENTPSENEQPPTVEATSGSLQRVWSIDNDLALRRPQLPAGSGYAWGLTPGGAQVPDPAAAEPSSLVPPTVTPPVAAVDREAPAPPPPPGIRPLPAPVPGVRAFYPEPSVISGQVPPAAPSASAAALGPILSAAGPPATPAPGADSSQPVPSTSVDVPPASVPPVRPVTSSPAEVESTSSIPTIEEVLDSPSPRRAAREAAILEAAAREAAAREATLRREAPPESARSFDQTGEPLAVHQPDESAQVAAALNARPISEGLPATPFPNSEHPNSGPERSQPVPLNARESSHPTVSPFGDPHAPVFIDEAAQESTAANAKMSRSTDAQQPGSAPQVPVLVPSTDPAAQAGVWREGDEAAASGAMGPRSSSANADDTPKPRNQRVVLFVLIGLVVALGLVLAANFLL